MNQQIITTLNSDELKSLIEHSVQKVIEKSNFAKDKPLLGNEDFITIKQASEFTHIAVTTLYDYTHKKKIPFHKVGKRLIFSKKELTERITSQNKQPINKHI